MSAERGLETFDEVLAVGQRVAEAWRCPVEAVTLRVRYEADGWLAEALGPSGARIAVVGQPTRDAAAQALAIASRDPFGETPDAAQTLAAALLALPEAQAFEALERATVGLAASVAHDRLREALFDAAETFRIAGEGMR